MRSMALTRKFVAITVAGFACGGAAWAAAAVMPPAASGHVGALDETTTVASDSTSSTVADSTSSTVVDETTTTVADETTTTTTVPETTTTVGGTTPTTVACNHGANVSKVAHEAPRGHDAAPGAHGKAVSAAAHIKCPGQGDGTDDDGESGDDVPSTTVPGAATAHGHGHGHKAP